MATTLPPHLEGNIAHQYHTLLKEALGKGTPTQLGEDMLDLSSLLEGATNLSETASKARLTLPQHNLLQELTQGITPNSAVIEAAANDYRRQP